MEFFVEREKIKYQNDPKQKLMRTKFEGNLWHCAVEERDASLYLFDAINYNIFVCTGHWALGAGQRLIDTIKIKEKEIKRLRLRYVFFSCAWPYELAT